jgi:hypothetical protein
VSYFNAIFRFSDSSLFFLFKSSDRSFIAVTISINIKGIRIVGEPSEIEMDGMIYKAANNCKNNKGISIYQEIDISHFRELLCKIFGKKIVPCVFTC